MMKVLFVVTWYTPLSENKIVSGIFHYEQCIALQKYCNIRLYWPFEPNCKGLYFGCDNGLFTYRSAAKRGMSLWGKIRWLKNTIKHFERICDDFKPDLIHANVAYPIGLLCTIISKKKHIPFILTEHAPIEGMGIDNPARKFLYYYIYKQAKKNICVSKHSAEQLRKYYPTCDFDVIYNATVDPDTVKMRTKNYRIADSINCGVVAVFYDKKIKGFQFLIPAIKKVNDLGHNVVLHICGGGEFLPYYEAFAREIGIEKKCIFYNQCDREELYTIISQMDYCISSSIYESAGVSVQEEMLLGKPILVTKSGGANSLITDYTAIVVERNSTKALVDGIIKMNSKYKSFNEKKIKDYARKNFEISNVTKRYIELYTEILS